jgi:hypothetical protein
MLMEGKLFCLPFRLSNPTYIETFYKPGGRLKVGCRCLCLEFWLQMGDKPVLDGARVTGLAEFSSIGRLIPWATFFKNTEVCSSNFWLLFSLYQLHMY